MKTKQASVGDVIKIPKNQGEYIVVEARMDGGGTGHGTHDLYLEGCHLY